jgi:hypothetical protein
MALRPFAFLALPVLLVGCEARSPVGGWPDGEPSAADAAPSTEIDASGFGSGDCFEASQVFFELEGSYAASPGGPALIGVSATRLSAQCARDEFAEGRHFRVEFEYVDFEDDAYDVPGFGAEDALHYAVPGYGPATSVEGVGLVGDASGGDFLADVCLPIATENIGFRFYDTAGNYSKVTCARVAD